MEVKKCRLCRSETGHFIYIFVNSEIQSNAVSDVISDVLQMEVTRTDTYPPFICRRCLCKLSEFKAFKKQCMASKEAFDNERILRDRDKLKLRGPLSDAPDNEPALDHTGEECEHVNASNHQLILQSIEDKPREEFILPDKADSINAMEKTFKKEADSCETVTEAPTETTFEDNIDNIHALGKMIKKERVFCETIAEAPTETTFETLEEESMPGGSNAEKHTTEESDMDEGDCDDVQAQCLREARKRRTEWSVVEFEGPSKRSACEGDDEEETVYLCNICGKKFVSFDNITQHLKYTHSDKKPFRCVTCGKTFKTKYTLKSHSQIHSEARPFSCKVCGRPFRLKRTLMDHELVHSGRKKYECVHCDKGFRSKADFERHQPSHDGTKVWECDECPESFGRWNEMVEHRDAHRRKKGLTCDMCGSKFRRKWELRSHIFTHTLPYRCDVCERKFSMACKLKIHMRSHTGEKPFQCTVCEKRFNRKYQLVEHAQSHTGEKPFQCNVCEKRFVVKRYLMQHMSTHAGD